MARKVKEKKQYGRKNRIRPAVTPKYMKVSQTSSCITTQSTNALPKNNVLMERSKNIIKNPILTKKQTSLNRKVKSKIFKEPKSILSNNKNSIQRKSTVCEENDSVTPRITNCRKRHRRQKLNASYQYLVDSDITDESIRSSSCTTIKRLKSNEGVSHTETAGEIIIIDSIQGCRMRIQF